jgi:HAD superfamily hydrolase (TIGR01458 family)
MSIKGLLLDVDGVLYQGNAAIPGAAEALERLRAASLPFRLITNTTRIRKAALIEKLLGFGLRIAPEELVTTAQIACEVISRDGARPYLLVHENLKPDLPPEAESTDSVLLGDAADGFTFARLNAAFRILIEGGRFYALARNRYFRTAGGLELDAGPFVAALEYASGVEARVIGKPDPDYFHAAARSAGLSPATTLMVGDDIEADVEGALHAGFQAALVRTGKFREADAARAERVGARVYPSVVEIIDGLLA